MDKDPKPLKASGGTPIELQRALHALRRTDDAARLARVAERLGATIAASSTPAASGLGTMTGTKIGLIGLAVSLGAAGVIGYSLLAERPAPAVKAPAAPAAVAMPAAAPAVEMPAAAAAAEAAAASADPIAPAEPVPAREPKRTRRASTRSPAPPHAGRARATEAPSIAAAAEPARSSTVEASSPKTPAASEASTAEASSPKTPAASEATEASTAEASKAEPPRANPVEPPTPQPFASPKPAAKPPLPAARASEAALLHEARKVASRQPETALRLIDEHARRFPSGVLVPERELLAIEVLRRLDRDAEAEQRLRRFEARYPRSIHLRRLERESSTEPR